MNTSQEDIRNAKNGKNPSVNTKSSERINFKIGDLNGKSVLMEPNMSSSRGRPHIFISLLGGFGGYSQYGITYKGR